MATEIYLVKVGMTMHEGTVEEWYVGDGEQVESGALLYRLETEKVNLDVDAETAGTVKHLVAEGTTLAPGQVVGYIYADGEEIPDTLPTPEATVDQSAAEQTAAPAEAPPRQRKRGERIAASPAARKLAAEKNIDLATVEGTGPRGRVTREDVQKAAATTTTRTVDDAAPQAGGATTSVPLRGIRKTIAERMAASLRESAQLTMDMEVAMDEAAKLRRDLNAEWADASGAGNAASAVRVTITDLVLLAATKALIKHPRMNAALIDNAIVQFNAVHIGVAVALAEGLIVPVIHNAQTKGLKDIASASTALAKRAREGALAVDDVEGGTFTVTSLGMFGVDGFTPILNSPQAGILGVGRIYEGVAWDGDIPIKAARMRLSLTWDHRLLDGAPAAEFLATVRDYLQAPYRLLV